jgi:hypothetical protein
MKRYILLLVILFSVISAAKADVLPDGKKKISYNFRLSNINSYPDYSIIAYPVNTSNGVPVIYSYFIKDSSAVNLSCKYGAPSLYIVKNTDFNRQRLDSINMIQDNNLRSKELHDFFFNNREVIHNSGKISCTSYVSRDEKYDAIEDELKIEKVSGDSMLIKTQRTIFKDNNGTIIDAKDSKSSIREDVVTPSASYTGYLIVILPVLSLILIVSILLIRKMKKP